MLDSFCKCKKERQLPQKLCLDKSNLTQWRKRLLLSRAITFGECVRKRQFTLTCWMNVLIACLLFCLVIPFMSFLFFSFHLILAVDFPEDFWPNYNLNFLLPFSSSNWWHPQHSKQKDWDIFLNMHRIAKQIYFLWGSHQHFAEWTKQTKSKDMVYDKSFICLCYGK